MYVYYYLALFIAALLNVVISKDTVPVFLLDYKKVLNNTSIMPDPLTALKPEEFTEIIISAIKKSHILVFVENTFSQEDVSLKDEFGTPFRHLRQGILDKNIKYLPAVISPYKILKDILKFSLHSDGVHYISSLDNKPHFTVDNRNKMFFIFKDDGMESRASVLRQHDGIIRDVYFMITQQTDQPVIAFYTGMYNPAVVDTIIHYRSENYLPRHIEDPGVMIRSRRGLFHFKGVTVDLGGRRSTLSSKPSVVGELLSSNTMTTRLSYPDFDLNFSFEFDRNYWTLFSISCLIDSIPVGLSIVDVTLPWGHSYVCGEPLLIRNRRDGGAIALPHIQVQPFLDIDAILRSDPEEPAPPETPDPAVSVPDPAGDNATKDFSFGASHQCTGYFSIGILSCLMVGFMLLAVLFYGITLMMSINSNDRFDDFKHPVYFGTTDAGGT